MKRFLHTDSVATGLVIGLGTMVVYTLLLLAGLAIAGEPLSAHLRWLGGMFIPIVLLLRHYAKNLRLLSVTRTLIVVLFVGFILYMVLLFRTNSIVLG